MPVDDTIYNSLMQPPRSALDYADDFARQGAQRTQNALQALQLQQNAGKLADDNQTRADRLGYRNALQVLDPNASIPDIIDAGRRLGTPFALDASERLATSYANQQETLGRAAESQSKVGKTNLETSILKANKTIGDIAGLSNATDASAALDAHFANGDISRENYLAAKQSIPSDPSQFPAWRRQMLIRTLDQKEQLEALSPKIDYQNTGGAMVPVQTNPNAGPVGPVAGMKPIPRQVSPDTAYTQAQENGRAAEGRKVQLRLGGYDANGNMLDLGLGSTAPAPGQPGSPAGGSPAAASPLRGLVDAIGTYQSPESVALARVPAAAKAQILAAVKQAYPDYDPGVYAARQSSNRDFSSAGASGKAVKSFNVALDHLDTLQDLVGKLNNGSIPVLNAAGNYISQQTGGDAVTNLKAAKNIVMNEVVKATTGVAGAEGDRDRAQAIIDNASSPEQLAGAIKTVKQLMAGQLGGLQRSYEVGTGRKDFQKQLSPTALRELSSLQGTGAAPNSKSASGASVSNW